MDTKRLSYILFQGHLPVLGAGQGAGSSEVGGTSTKAGEGRGGGEGMNKSASSCVWFLSRL